MIENRSHGYTSRLIVLSALLALGGCRTPAKSPPPSTAPTGPDPYITGLESLDNGQTDKAAADLAAAVQNNPDAIMPREKLADIYLQQKDYTHAENQYQVLTTLDPYTEPNFYELGYCQQLLNELPQAMASYQQALVLDPHDAKAATNLGVVYLSLNQTDDAVKYLDQATKLDDKSWYAWASFGIALDAHNQYHDAEQAYRKSMEIDPSQTSTMYNLGSNLITQGRASDAIPILQELIKREDSARFHKKYADALAADNQYANAIAEYRKALQIDAKYYWALNAAASYSIQQYEKEAEFDENKKSTALDFWRQSLVLNANQPEVTAQLKKWGGK